MNKIEETLTRGVAEILPSEKALAALMAEKKIKLYWGIDPTGSQLHIGHAVALRKLKQFQELGHHIIFLVGDFTAMIGDPSGKTSSRPVLTREEVLKNAETYKEQASKILDFEGPNPIEIKLNSEWLAKMSAIEFMQLARNLTYAQIVERDMFQKRFAEGQDIFMNEFLYPFMQAYDSVALDVDLEIGGTDQKFNMLMGRKLMRNVAKKEKFVMTLPLLTDSRGNKIGKSEGNIIGLTDKPEEFYAKIMSLGDDSIFACFELLTDEIVSKSEVEKDPFKYKKLLAFKLTAWLNSEIEAVEAQKNWEHTFQDNQFSSDASPSPAAESLVDTIAQLPEVGSRSKAKRLIKDGAIDIDGETITDMDFIITKGQKIKVGKRFFHITE